MHLLPFLLIGCAPVVEAPTELDELMGFLFAHVEDEDDATLAAGAVNLDTWLIQRMGETQEGYTINDLDEATLEGIGYTGLDMERLAGAAVGHVSTQKPDPLVEAATSVDNEEIYGSSYAMYERTYLTDLDCFLEKSEGCELLDSEVHQIADYSIITVESHSQVQYRWVETDSGWVMVERTWLLDKATISVDWIALDAQFFIWAVIPSADGTARTIQATWVVAEILGGDVDSDTALKIMINSMGDNQETLDDYVAEH